MEIDLQERMAQFTKAFQAQVQSRAFRAANELRNAELKVLSGSRSGRVYHDPSRYRASAPGEPPAVRSGDLRKSWTPQTRLNRGADRVSISASIHSAVAYAGYLQTGTSKMAARPYTEQVIEQALPQIRAIMDAPYF